MSYQVDSSRILDSALRTPAQLRAAFARIISAMRTDRGVLDDVSEEVDLVLAGVRQPAIADEALIVGDAVRLASAGHIEKAQADAVANGDAIGICTKAANSGGETEYSPSGVVEKPAWGLTNGAIYYLSAGTSGGITTTAPSTTGQIVRIIGEALSTETLLVKIESGVLL